MQISLFTAVDHSFTAKMRTKIDKRLNEVVRTVSGLERLVGAEFSVLTAV